MEKQIPTPGFRTVDELKSRNSDEISGAKPLKPRDAIKYPEDRVPGSLHIESEVDPQDLRKKREKYWIPQSVELIAPISDWKACAPPVGYGTVYLGQLEAGFRIPAHKFWAQLSGEEIPEGLRIYDHNLEEK